MKGVRQAFQILAAVAAGVSAAIWVPCVVQLVSDRGSGYAEALEGAISRSSERRYLTTDSALIELLPRIEGATGTETPAAADLIDHLALAAEREGRSEKAEDHYRRALEIREATLGPRHLATGQSCLYLGSLFQARGDRARAELYLTRALSIAEQSAQEETSGLLARLVSRLRGEPNRRAWIDDLTIAALDGLGTLHREAGRLDQARPIAERAVGLVSEAGASPSARATVFANAGLLAHDLGEYARAEEWHLRALDALSGEGEGADPIRAAIWNNLASVQLALGRQAEARESLRRARELLGAGTSELPALRAALTSNAANVEQLFRPRVPEAIRPHRTPGG